MGLRRLALLPDNAYQALNGFVIHISLPAVILLQLHAVTLEPALI